MLNEKYCVELVNDFETFNKITGAAENLADRGWREDVWCDDSYKEEIEELYIKYLPDESNNFIPIKVDDYLEVENKLESFFKNEILELMR